jgi:hypothetical protein
MVTTQRAVLAWVVMSAVAVRTVLNQEAAFGGCLPERLIPWKHYRGGQEVFG